MSRFSTHFFLQTIISLGDIEYYHDTSQFELADDDKEVDVVLLTWPCIEGLRLGARKPHLSCLSALALLQPRSLLGLFCPHHGRPPPLSIMQVSLGLEGR